MNITVVPTIEYSKTVELNTTSAANVNPRIFFEGDRVFDSSILTGIKVNVLSATDPVGIIGNLAKVATWHQQDTRFFVLTLVRCNEITGVEETIHENIPMYDLTGLVGLAVFRYVRKFNCRITLEKCYIQKSDAAQSIARTASITFYYKPI